MCVETREVEVPTAPFWYQPVRPEKNLYYKYCRGTEYCEHSKSILDSSFETSSIEWRWPWSSLFIVSIKKNYEEFRTRISFNADRAVLFNAIPDPYEAKSTLIRAGLIAGFTITLKIKFFHFYALNQTQVVKKVFMKSSRSVPKFFYFVKFVINYRIYIWPVLRIEDWDTFRHSWH